MSAKFMIDEMCAPVMEMLAMRFAARVIDYYMGNYELEEGEVIDHVWTQDDLRHLAESIVMTPDEVETNAETECEYYYYESESDSE